VEDYRSATFAYLSLKKVVSLCRHLIIVGDRATLKRANLEVVEAKIQEAPMIYKGTERLCGDPNPLQKKVKDYRSAASAYLSLNKAVSLCCHSIIVGQQKAAYIEEVELAQSHLVMVHTDLDALQERYRNIIQRTSIIPPTLNHI